MTRNINQIKSLIGSEGNSLKSVFGIKSLGVFGSLVRHEEKPDSDIDILVEFSQTPGFFRFLDLEKQLTDLTGRKVDLVTKNALKPALKEDILKEVVYV